MYKGKGTGSHNFTDPVSKDICNCWVTVGVVPFCVYRPDPVNGSLDYLAVLLLALLERLFRSLDISRLKITKISDSERPHTLIS
jgi:hypothetical protein